MWLMRLTEEFSEACAGVEKEMVIAQDKDVNLPYVSWEVY